MKLRKLLLPISIIIFVKILFYFNFFLKLENLAHDSLFRIRGKQPISDDIVIVAVDDATLQDLNIRWPFPREYHAHLIENLKKAGAREIIFDIEFTEDVDPFGDMMLASKAKEAGNVIFAGKHIRHPLYRDNVQMVTPIRPIMTQEINWGIVNMPLDSDGFIRRYSLFETMGKEKYYSLGVAALANYRIYQKEWQKDITIKEGHLKVGGHRIPIIQGNKAWLNLFGPSKTFPHISYASVLDDSTFDLSGLDLNQYEELVQNKTFENKIVLIGVTIDEMHDKFPTAFSSVLTDGVEIHANFIEMVKQGKYLYHINPWFFLLLQLICGILVYFLLSWFRPQLAAIVTIILIIGLIIGGYFLFVKANLLIPLVEVALAWVFLYVAALITHYIKSQKEKRFIRNAFQQYLAPDLVDELIRHPEKLKYGGSLQEITVLFSDIVSFTTYSEKHKPEETVQILKEYLTEMVKTIINNGGIVDKFVGDEVMALYGVPIFTEEHALQACKTALDMRERLTQLQEKWVNEGREPFEIGIGINTGYAVVGNLGSEQIFDYTAIGDTINLGARLEAITRNYQTQKKIIISEFTLAKVQDYVEVRYLDEVKVKGKDIPVKIYELIGLK